MTALSNSGILLEAAYEEWSSDCNRMPKAIYSNASSSAVPVPRAWRVEALCYAELNHRRTNQQLGSSGV